MKKLSIYIASSWKQKAKVNELAASLRRHTDIIEEVYDFTDPEKRGEPFLWAQVVDKPAPYSVEEFYRFLKNPVAIKAFQRDMSAMQRADVCILLLPAGASAHSEAGWFAGQGKLVIVLSPIIIDNLELMYNMYDWVIGDIDSLYASLFLYRDKIATKEAPKSETESSEFCPVKTDNVLAAISPRTQVLVKTEGGRIGYVELDHVRALINPDSNKSEKQLTESERAILEREKQRLVDQLIAVVNSFETKL